MKLLRFLVPLVLAASFSAPALRAQETPAEHAQVQQEGHAPEAEGKEAKGEEHEGHHAPLKLMGMELHRPGQFAVQLFNFALFAGLLVFLLKGALASAFKARAKELEEKLSQAERDRAEADAQIKELEARMAGLQAELAGIMARAETEAEAEKARIIESAKLEAAQILAQTQAEIAFQTRAAEAGLRTLVAELAVEGATRRLQNQVTGDMAAQVIDRSITQVGGSK